MIPIRNPRPVRLEIESHGAAPKKTFGTGAYKFSKGAGILLVRRGWTKLKETRGSVILRPPTVGSQKPPFIIDIDLPSREEVLELAEQRHALGTKWLGKLGEWGAIYDPATTYTVKTVDLFSDAPPVDLPHEGGVIPARFEVGMLLIWSCWVNWQTGTADCAESTERIRGTLPAQPASLFDDLEEDVAVGEESDRFEGAVKRVERNEYERDAKARQLCIARHGAFCAACGADFGKTYGPLAEGFIHVHHHVLISERGGEYKVDPINDLVPVCPNCHAVMHMNDPPLTVAAVRALLKANRSG